jgi:2-methylcitrate dehydratase PrpD
LHPSATIVPTCLAAAELVDAPGTAFLSAVAVGLEVCVRLGMAGYDRKLKNSVYFDRGQHATSICGTMAGAGAAASLLGFDEEHIAHAMSVATSMAGGVIEANRTGGTVKRIHCGWAAHSALTAASLVQHGFTGPPTVLEGRFGFFEAFLSGNYEAAEITEGLGEQWSVPGIFFKPYPANHFTHAGIDAAMALRKSGLRIDDLAALRLGVAGPTVHTIGEPIESKRLPETGYQAQFSGPYTVVAAFLGGEGLGLGLDDFTDALAQDPVRRAHMAKVEVVEDARCNEIFPEQFPAVLEVRTHAGETFVERVEVNRGGPGKPLSLEELQVKFHDNARRVLDEPGIEAITTAVAALGKDGSVPACLAPAAGALFDHPLADLPPSS